jgi:hypothetical protein
VTVANNMDCSSLFRVSLARLFKYRGRHAP